MKRCRRSRSTTGKSNSKYNNKHKFREASTLRLPAATREDTQEETEVVAARTTRSATSKTKSNSIRAKMDSNSTRHSLATITTREINLTNHKETSTVQMVEASTNKRTRATNSNISRSRPMVNIRMTTLKWSALPAFLLSSSPEKVACKSKAVRTNRNEAQTRTAKAVADISRTTKINK